MRHKCAGCSKPLHRNHKQYICHFCDTGFTLPDGRKLRPCLTRYHPNCVRIGVPFTTRLPKEGGLYCPNDLAAWKHFICEACTVRSVLEREIGHTAADLCLLMLERARLIDTMNHWAKGSLQAYQTKFRIIQNFASTFQVPILKPTTLLAPPRGAAIKLMWAQERYSLYPSEWRKKNSNLADTIKFGTIRGLRSAAAHFWIWDLLHTNPDKLTLGFRDRPMVVHGCSPTDEVAYTYFTDGLKRRLGDNPKPSTVLLLDHMIWIDAYFESIFEPATNGQVCINICRAATTHLLALLGWLRAKETFGVRWADIEIWTPQQGPALGLPAGVGAILCKLLPQTKSSQTSTADVVLAYTTALGLSLGKWLHRLQQILPQQQLVPEAYVISHANGLPWTSHYYRHTYFYPALYILRALGDPYLARYDDSPGKELTKAIWSFNTYRRTGRSIVSKRRARTLRAATAPETVEHGRWRVSRSTLDMPTAYLEWSYEDRICITLFCS